MKRLVVVMVLVQSLIVALLVGWWIWRAAAPPQTERPLAVPPLLRNPIDASTKSVQSREAADVPDGRPDAAADTR